MIWAFRVPYTGDGGKDVKRNRMDDNQSHFVGYLYGK